MNAVSIPQYGAFAPRNQFDTSQLLQGNVGGVFNKTTSVIKDLITDSKAQFLGAGCFGTVHRIANQSVVRVSGYDYAFLKTLKIALANPEVQAFPIIQGFAWTDDKGMVTVMEELQPVSEALAKETLQSFEEFRETGKCPTYFLEAFNCIAQSTRFMNHHDLTNPKNIMCRESGEVVLTDFHAAADILSLLKKFVVEKMPREQLPMVWKAYDALRGWSPDGKSEEELFEYYNKNLKNRSQ